MNSTFIRGMSVTAIALALAACGDNKTNTPGAGVDASSTTGTSVSVGESDSRERQVSVDKSASAKINMPAWALMVEAAGELREEISDTQDGEVMHCPYGLGDAPVLDFFAEFFNDYYYLGAISSHNCVKTLNLLQNILASVEPVRGWPFSIHQMNSLGPDVSAFINAKAILAEKVNLMAVEIIKSVEANALRDPDDAKTKIKMAMAEFVKSGGYDAVNAKFSEYVDGKKPFCHHAIVNIAGNQKSAVEFTCDGSLYGGDTNGWQTVKHGVDWFGNGVIMGRKIDLALDSAISASMSKRDGTSSEQRDEAGTATGGKSDLR